MTRSIWLAASMAGMLVLACSSQKQPAQQAIENIDSSLAAAHDTAAKYSPDQLQTVEGQVAALKSDFSKGDYKAVLAGAPAVSTAVAGLKSDADSKQGAADAAAAKLKQQWRNLSADVPKMLETLQARVDTLAKSKKLPKGVNKAAYESAKSDLPGLTTAWTEATNAVANSDYEGAVQKGQGVKDKATEMESSLGISKS